MWFGWKQSKKRQFVRTKLINDNNINPDDVTHPLHEKGAVGSIMSALVGYDGNPGTAR